MQNLAAVMKKVQNSRQNDVIKQTILIPPIKVDPIPSDRDDETRPTTRIQRHRLLEIQKAIDLSG